jgi:hypothetical protein
MSDKLPMQFPPPIDVREIEERWSKLFVQGRFFAEGHECSPYVRLANDVQPLLREVARLNTENERLRAALQEIVQHPAPSNVARVAHDALSRT